MSRVPELEDEFEFEFEGRLMVGGELVVCVGVV
jgi:hypothetical protein